MVRDGDAPAAVRAVRVVHEVASPAALWKPELPGIAAASDHCLRWSERRHSWRHARDGGFDRRRYDVALLDEADARAFTQTHHYSHTYPAARFAYGLFTRGQLVGVSVFSVPTHPGVLTGVFPRLRPYAESLLLARLVLLDEVPANGESFFVARAFEQAAGHGIRGVVTFSDPFARTNSSGRVVFSGHVGVVYQASNARFLGRSGARTIAVLPDGSVLHERSLAKVRAGHRGHAAVERRLQTFGATPRPEGEPGAEWLARALRDAGARWARHPGCYRYAFTFGRREAKRSVVIALPGRPYPKRVDAPRARLAA